MKIKRVLIVLPLLFTALISADYRQGVDYRLVDNPLPVKKDGVVEVTEVFWYECAAFFAFYPAVSRWSKSLDDDVSFKKMHVTWQKIHQSQAAMFYVIESLKLGEEAHSAAFFGIHKEGKRLRSDNQIVDFLKNFGITSDQARQYLKSFSINQKVKRADKTIRQLQIQSTPSVIVDGKYIITPKRTYEEFFKVVEHVVNIQKPNS